MKLNRLLNFDGTAVYTGGTPSSIAFVVDVGANYSNTIIKNVYVQYICYNAGQPIDCNTLNVVTFLQNVDRDNLNIYIPSQSNYIQNVDLIASRTELKLVSDFPAFMQTFAGLVPDEVQVRASVLLEVVG